MPKGVAKGSIKVGLMSPTDHTDTMRISVDIERHGKKERIKRFEPADGQFTDRLFVCAYGGSRVLNGTEDYDYYRAIDAVYSLFQYSQPLQNPELIIRRVKSWGGDQDDLLRSLNSLLMLPENSVKLEKTGLEISGPWKSPTQLGSLGDGYRSMVNWVSDLIGWSIYYYDELVNPEDLYGIVLLDEIELNLHPKWQRKIIKLLNDQFPNLQFFVTSHSAVCTLGMTDIEDECEAKMFVFEHGQKGVLATEAPIAAARQRLDRIFTSTLFQLRSVSDDKTEGMIQELAAMSSSETIKSDQELAKEERLIEKINQSIAGATRDSGDAIARTFTTGLENQLIEALSKQSLDKITKTIGTIEIKRKLSGL